jgi:hypothetical protein
VRSCQNQESRLLWRAHACQRRNQCNQRHVRSWPVGAATTTLPSRCQLTDRCCRSCRTSAGTSHGCCRALGKGSGRCAPTGRMELVDARRLATEVQRRPSLAKLMARVTFGILAASMRTGHHHHAIEDSRG